MTTVLLVRIAISAIATTFAAIAAERALRDVGRAGRFVWAGALLLGATTSVVVVTGGSLPLDAPARFTSWLASPVGPGVASAVADASVAATNPLPYAWLAMSFALIALVAVALLRQRLRLRAARVEHVGGVDVMVTRALGPAVMGFLHPRIVVPDWLLDRSDEERRLVIEHEAEHIAARDPLLAAAGLLVVCLVPWNPLLWYQLRRLRLAIELDCDARVLRRGDARAYSRLLVDVADRLARGTPLATALAFPRNFLEWRIRMITNRRTRPLHAAVWTVAAGALVVAACADTDPVATDTPAAAQVVVEELREPVDVVVNVDENGSGDVPLAPMMKEPLPPGAPNADVDLNRADGESKIQIDSLRPTPGGIVRYRRPAPEGLDVDAEAAAAERRSFERVPLQALEAGRE